MFEWNESFSVKVPFIDEQHKRLFEIGEKINELLLDHNGGDSFEEIMDTIDELESYTVYHFKEEEKMMLHYNYPELESHKIQHQKFISYLNNLDIMEINGNQEETLKELIKFVAVWIIEHINNSDFKYSDYIKE